MFKTSFLNTYDIGNTRVYTLNHKYYKVHTFETHCARTLCLGDELRIHKMNIGL